MAEEMHVAPAAEASDDELLTGIIRELIAEIHPPAAGLPVFLDSRLAADLGLDSLAVVELRSRLEEASGVVLPDGILTGETPREWLDALRGPRPRRPARFRPARTLARAHAGSSRARAGRPAHSRGDAARCAGLACPGSTVAHLHPRA
ncbi:MAG: acyl carrier protein [Streptosporangiaceae bacterium]